MAEVRPDVLWFSRLAAGRYLEDKGGALAVLDQHDLSSQLWRLMRAGAAQALGPAFRRQRTAISSSATSVGSIRGFDVSVSVSDAERELTRDACYRAQASPP